MHPLKHAPVPRTPFTLTDQRLGGWQGPLSASTHRGLRQEEAPLWVLTAAECLQPMRQEGSPAPPVPPPAQPRGGQASAPRRPSLPSLLGSASQRSAEHGGNTVSGRQDLPPQHEHVPEYHPALLGAVQNPGTDGKGWGPLRSTGDPVMGGGPPELALWSGTPRAFLLHR